MPEWSIWNAERAQMTPALRRDEMVRRAQSGQRLGVEALALEFGTSRETIRRDLAALDRQGALRRVHGGARPGGEEGPFQDRLRAHVEAKRAMARHLAQGLRPGDSLFIDTGRTTQFLAEEIALCKGLIIITNSADIANLCQKGEGNRVFLIGGEFRAEGRESVGPLAVAQIGQLRAAQVVLTVAAVTERGVYDIDPQEAEIARAMVAQADQVTVLADGSKMGRAGVFEVCPMARVGRIVTDAMDTPLRLAAEAAGVFVDIVTVA